MNKNLSYKSPHSSKPNRGHSRRAKVDQPKSNRLVITVPTCDSPQEQLSFTEELINALELAPEILSLRFIGPHQMSPDAALLAYDILAASRGNVTIVTEAWSPLIDASVLMWLAGNVRRIRSTTCVHFRSLREIQRRRRCRLPWEEAKDFMPDEPDQGDQLWAADYKAVLELMGQYLPVDQFSDQIISPAMLGEMALLEGNELDRLLLGCMGEECSFVARMAESKPSQRITPSAPNRRSASHIKAGGDL